MSVIQGNAIESGLAAYEISNSLRFNSADSAYLSRTPASAGNRKVMTWNLWIKKSSIASANKYLFACNDEYIRFNDTITDTLRVKVASSNLITTQLFRDSSAWGMLTIAVDTTQATASNRVKVYWNGIRITAFGTETYPTQNADAIFNTADLHRIGSYAPTAEGFYDGYMTEINFIDGQALDPTNFGKYNSDTGVWQPKAYAGTYGTNGFYLNFSDNSNTTSTTLGKDYSGNSNNWTPNNFSVTAGAGNDSLVDTPTPYGTDTGVGAEVRGNYCTMSPILGGGTTNVNGNLDVTCPDNKSTGGTFGMSSGKWYFEATVASSLYVSLGVARNDEIWGTNLNGSSEAFMYSYVGTVYTKGSADTTPDSFTTNDIISVCVDLDNNKLYFLKNGTGITVAAGTQNPSTGTNGISLDAGYTYFSAITANGNSAVAYFNFGQRPFAYAAPTGFKALCTTNLPDPAIADGSTAFNAAPYTGTGTTGLAVTTGHASGLVWIKDRQDPNHHVLFDQVRGVTKTLASNLTNAESTNSAGKGLISFDSNGFTLGTELDVSPGSVNASPAGRPYAAWSWKAGGTGVSNTAGSITSTVSANPTAGFSIVTYTGTGSNATVGHGLSSAPSFVVVKSRSLGTENWPVYHKYMNATPAAGRLLLNLTSAYAANSAMWNSTAPTSSVFSIGTDSQTNTSSATYVAYCFAPVESYSAFGSYTGNGSTDGPFVYTGFRPRYIMLKCSSTSGLRWNIFDTSRSPYNVGAQTLYADASNAEDSGTGADYDILSNGFKLRSTNSNPNTSGATYIYAAFAENPFKYALAR